MKKIIIIVILLMPIKLFAGAGLESISPSPTGSWDFTSGTLFCKEPTVSSHTVNMGYATSTVAGLNIGDSPANEEILKYDSASGNVYWVADTGGGGGTGEAKHRLALYGGCGMSDIYNSSDTTNTWGSWFEVAGATGTIIEWHIAVASTTTDAFTVRLWRNGTSTGTISMAAGDSYKEYSLSTIDCDKDTVIGIDFEDVDDADPAGGISVIAILKED